MSRIVVFLVLSIPVVILSWRSLSRARGHGFYRFFAWECILWLFASSFTVWFADPASPGQLASWLLLVISALMVVSGAVSMHKRGKADGSRNDDSLFRFEQTTNLVETGIFSKIRHPLYGSLIVLAWAIFLKNPSAELAAVAAAASLLLYLTARADEKECTDYFGDAYRHYMKRTKMFIPLIF